MKKCFRLDPVHHYAHLGWTSRTDNRLDYEGTVERKRTNYADTLTDHWFGGYDYSFFNPKDRWGFYRKRKEVRQDDSGDPPAGSPTLSFTPEGLAIWQVPGSWTGLRFREWRGKRHRYRRLAPPPDLTGSKVMQVDRPMQLAKGERYEAWVIPAGMSIRSFLKYCNSG